MVAYMVRRLLASLALVAASSVLVFAVVAGTFDPLAELRTRQPSPPAAVLQRTEAALGLDRPLPERYLAWAGGVLSGDLGTSARGVDIRADLGERLLTSATLALPSALLAVVLAIAVGTLGAVQWHRPADRLTTVLAVVVMALPVAWSAGLVRAAGIRVNELTGVGLPVTGESTPGLEASVLGDVTDRAAHAALPVLLLAAVLAASWSRIHRAATVTALSAPPVRTVRALGLSERRILLRHVLRGACIPLTTVVALDVGAALGGLVVVEQAFGWHGMGEMLVLSVRDQDVDRLLAWLLVAACAVVGANLAADVAVAALDPRTRGDR